MEKTISESIQKSDQGSFMALDPGIAQNIMNSLANQIQDNASGELQPVILCSSQIRSQFKKFLDRFIPNMIVISYNDILNSARLQSLGTVRIANAD